MTFFMKTLKTLRNNWKKSTFGFVVLSYAGSSLKNRYDTNMFMRARCEEVSRYGDERLPVHEQPRSITVILNPAANRRKAKTEYEKYCEPLFHLAGISVNLLQTDSEGHAKRLIANIPDNETVIIAGGDGTFCETITGLLRNKERNTDRTIGVLPLGRRNYTGNRLFPDKSNRVKQLTDATMAIINDRTCLGDVMKIEAVETETEVPGKPIFAMGPIEWGAFRDTIARRDKYWMYGGFREYASFVFNGYKSSLCWECKGTLKITPPCEGCSNCRKAPEPKPAKFTLLNFLIPKQDSKVGGVDYGNINNERCSEIEETCFKTTELNVIAVERNDKDPPHLALVLNKMGLGYFEFIQQGWRRLSGDFFPVGGDSIKARSVELLPLNLSEPGKEIWFNIDNEEFDAKPIKITVLPEALRLYHNKG